MERHGRAAATPPQAGCGLGPARAGGQVGLRGAPGAALGRLRGGGAAWGAGLGRDVGATGGGRRPGLRPGGRPDGRIDRAGDRGAVGSVFRGAAPGCGASVPAWAIGGSMVRSPSRIWPISAAPTLPPLSAARRRPRQSINAAMASAGVRGALGICLC